MLPQFRLCFGVLVQKDFFCQWYNDECRSRSLHPIPGAHKRPHLRQTTITRLTARWTVSLTHAAMHAYAASLLSMPCEGAITGEDAHPLLGDLPAQHPEAATAASRLGHDLAFLYGLSFLDFLRWISSSWIPARWIWGNSVRLAAAKRSEEKNKMEATNPNVFTFLDYECKPLQ